MKPDMHKQMTLQLTEPDVIDIYSHHYDVSMQLPDSWKQKIFYPNPHRERVA